MPAATQNNTPGVAANAVFGFRKRYGRAYRSLVAAPGRVNLIGEHVDYMGGFVMPMAIDRYTAIAIAPSEDRHLIRIGSGLTNSDYQFNLEQGREAIRKAPGWARYVLGVAQLMIERSEPVLGFDAWIETDIPLGAGLSSSAALEVATALAIDTVHDRTRGSMQIAQLCQRAEHEFAGVPCGIMDMATSACARAGHAAFLDCRSGHIEQLPMKDDSVAVVIANTKVQHALSDGFYAKRREACEKAADAMGIPLLRDATPEMLSSHQDALSPTVYRRARHVISEIARAEEAAAYLKRQDWQAFGRCMYESHESLRSDFEVSCDELDIMVAIARQIGLAGGVYGARMTGGGFGGSAVMLVSKEHAGSLIKQLSAAYEQETGITPDIFLAQPAQGAHVIDLQELKAQEALS
ncbi:MAG: galactokinase [Planctomycetota bacterium]